MGIPKLFLSIPRNIIGEYFDYSLFWLYSLKIINLIEFLNIFNYIFQSVIQLLHV